MRFVAGIFGLLGALAGAALGFKWLSDLNSDDGKAARALASLAGADQAAELAGLTRATYALLVCGVIGLVTSILVMARKGQRFANAGVLIVAGGLPLVFATNAVFGTPMILAGLLALAVKYDRAPAA